MQLRWEPWLTAGLAILLCWVLAQWMWLVLAPTTRLPQAKAAPVSAAAAAASVASLHLFGRASTHLKQPEGLAATPLNLKLHGVFAAIGNLPGFAILSMDGKPAQPVQAGASIAPGVVLASVLPDRVELNRQGSVERLSLEVRAGGRGVASVVEATASAPSHSPGNYRFSRSELNQAMQDTKQLANLGKFTIRPGGSGMLVNEAPHGSLAQKLGLQAGDVITRLNGQVVTTLDDVGRFYQQLNQNGQVRLRGVRAGRPLQMIYAVN